MKYIKLVSTEHLFGWELSPGSEGHSTHGQPPLLAQDDKREAWAQHCNFCMWSLSRALPIGLKFINSGKK